MCRTGVMQRCSIGSGEGIDVGTSPQEEGSESRVAIVRGIMEWRHMVGRGLGVDHGLCLDEQIRSHDVAGVRSLVQGRRAIGRGGVDVGVAAQQQLDHLDVATFASVVQRGAAAVGGVGDVDVGAALEQTLDARNVAVTCCSDERFVGAEPSREY